MVEKFNLIKKQKNKHYFIIIPFVFTKFNIEDEKMEKNNLHFFLGGSDLEMKTIKDLLDKEGISYSDAKLGWWEAKTSKYGDEIEKVAKEGKIPVIVELGIDSKLPEGTINIDHHNENAGNPASILQVCDLLGVEKTRDYLLVAANDTGMANGMREIGATEQEIAKIRYRDRAVQGITPEQEEQAEKALKEAKEIGGVMIVTCKHSRTAAILDRLDRDKNPDVFMYSTSDGEINFSGDGLICKKLTERFPDSDNFSGGSGFGKKGEMAYWGGKKADPNEAAKFVIKAKRQQENADTAELDIVTAKILKDFSNSK